MTSATLVQKYLSFIARFAGNRRGNVAIVFGLSIVPIFALTLGIVQFGEALSVRRSMCNASDAAALLAAANPDRSLDYLSERANNIFEHNFKRHEDEVHHIDQDLAYDADADTYSYTVRADMDTPLYSLVGIDTIPVSCGVEAMPERNGLEIVFALDTTGSMGFGSSWEDATAAMANILPSIQAMADSDEFFVSFFPFSDRVNIGKTVSHWNDWLGDKEILVKNNGTPKDLNYGQWNGCVEPRPADPQSHDWRLDDDTPSTERFIPSDPSMVFDSTKEHLDDGGLVNKSSSYSHCNSEQILGPTNDPSSITSAIEDITLKGTGRFDIGMAWAWRMISPKWRGLWNVQDDGYFGYPSEYGERRKVVVFITDAYTTAYDYEVCDTPGEGNCANYGFNKGSQKGFENMVDVCTKMKNEGIDIHTIYVNGNSYGVPYLQECATSIGNHYHAVSDVSELTTALEKIKSALSEVRLTR